MPPLATAPLAPPLATASLATARLVSPCLTRLYTLPGSNVPPPRTPQLAHQCAPPGPGQPMRAFTSLRLALLHRHSPQCVQDGGRTLSPLHRPRQRNSVPVDAHLHADAPTRTPLLSPGRQGHTAWLPLARRSSLSASHADPDTYQHMPTSAPLQRNSGIHLLPC